MPELRRIAVVNRGEPAMRLIRAVREWNGEHGASVRAVALYTTPERRAMFVHEADEAYELGAATFVDPRDGEEKVRYLDLVALERALRDTGADAVWAGWGFVAERADFVELCERLGVTFIGPTAEMLRGLGDKIASKRLAESLDIPVVPWSGGAVRDLADALVHAGRLGYPLLVKATAGGGGRGIREVRDETELADALARARAEAMTAFGDDGVFLERLVAGARHVEVQVIADGERCWAVGVRDCTLQRRHQKVLEETPSPALTPEQDAALRAAAVRLCDAIGYRSAGTVEFLYDDAARRFAFMEVNARLQVEHPVTEAVTGLDLVKLQLHVASGGRLVGEPPVARGHAIEVRLNAEDPDAGFAAAPGRITLLRLPGGPGVRVETGVDEGSVVPAQFDSMLAKIIAHGRDRPEALARVRRAVAETAVLLEGGTTNKGFLLELLDDPEVRRGAYDVGWLDRRRRGVGSVRARSHADVALVGAAIAASEGELAIERTRFLALAARGRPQTEARIGRTIELRMYDHDYAVTVRHLGPRRFRIAADGCELDAVVEHHVPSDWRLAIGDQRFRVRQAVQGITHAVEVDGVPHRLTRERAGVVRAPTPGVVLRVDVRVGDVVHVGDRLLALEAMKMEHSVHAGFEGTVRELLVRDNVQVAMGAPLLFIEPLRDASVAVAAAPVDLAGLAAGADAVDTGSLCRRHLDELRTLLLGYDADVAELRRRGFPATPCDATPEVDAELREREDELLELFADVTLLFHRRRLDEPDEIEALHRPSQEYLIAYLRDPDARGRGLPAPFVTRLRGVLARYGVESMERTPALEEALFRIARSHQQADEQADLLAAVLQRRLAWIAGTPAPPADDAFRALLERVLSATQNVYPALNDLAREIRYRLFDQPLLDHARRRAYDEAEAQLAHLAAHEPCGDRDDRIAALVACPQPLHGLLAARFAGASEPLRAAMLEVMARRYYRRRSLENARLTEHDGRQFFRAEYVHEGHRRHLLATHATYEEVTETLAALRDAAAELPAADVVAELYLWTRHALDAPDEIATELRAAINGELGGLAMRRVVVVLAAPESGTRVAGKLHFTFRASPSGYWEERLYEGVLPRGLHPMMAERLHLKRLANFAVERLPSSEDVYLVHAVARENPTDERLVGIAEVRDATPVRDASGRVVQLPYLEHTLMGVLSAMREYQAARAASGRERLFWNHVLLHVWPSLALRRDEIDDIVAKLAPLTEGLGLEAVTVNARIQRAPGEPPRETAIVLTRVAASIAMRFEQPTTAPVTPLGDFERHVVRLRRRGLVSPYEIVSMLTPSADAPAGAIPPGAFVEYDLDADGALVPVQRAYGRNGANVVVGVVRNFTAKFPEGMERVILLGDPTRGMGSLAEPECRRIDAALALARERHLPCEWFALSAGARIAMDSGTENMDWIALTLRRIVEFTQGGGELNVIVVGINVGAQPYWNAEATMLMHTRGILVMTGEGAMVLTGRQALDFSGGVSADDNLDIGGFEHVMGPNGEAQYGARDIPEACDILLRHYDHAYVRWPERGPRIAHTADPEDRDVRLFPHGPLDGGDFATIGDIFSPERNPGRKKPFDMRRVMRAVTDQDHQPLERWGAMQGGEIAVVWDAHVGGHPVCLIGLESRPLTRLGFIPADGPEAWTGGTLFPRSSKKVARAINAVSANRPVVVLANLSGFDGSPESMRNLQLEYGAEIGRAVVNFVGPIVFVVISRYHGGAFVVFSNRLRDNMEIAALEGSYASVIGGAPAAAVVFAREVDQRTRRDPRVRDAEEQAARATGAERVRLQALAKQCFEEVHAQCLGELAAEFDAVHTVQRARKVGSVHQIISAERLRPFVIAAIERGLRRDAASPAAADGVLAPSDTHLAGV